MARTDDGDSEWYLIRIGTFVNPVHIPLNQSEIIVGRVSSKCIKSQYVSRKHACFVKFEGNWYIEDLGSTNGTFLNNEKISTDCMHPIHESDVIGLGMAISTSEDCFSFKLCKNSKRVKCEGRNEIHSDQLVNVQKTGGRRLSRDTSNSDFSTEIFAENDESALDGTLLSTVDYPQPLQHSHFNQPIKSTALTELPLSNGTLTNYSVLQNNENCLPKNVSVNYSSSKRKKNNCATSLTKQCVISNSEKTQNSENKYFEPLLTIENVSHVASCGSISSEAYAEKRSENQGTSTDLKSDSTEFPKHYITAKSEMHLHKFQKTTHVSHITAERNCTSMCIQSVFKNNTNHGCSKTATSEPSSDGGLPGLIGAEMIVGRKSLCSYKDVSVQTESKLDLSTVTVKEPKIKCKNKLDCNVNVITVPDDGTPIIESIEIKEDIIVLSDCDDDDCIVVDESSNSISVLNHVSQSRNDKVKVKNAVAQPSVSNHCNSPVNQVAENFIELNESSNDTHFSETVDDSVDFENSKPEINIDESKLFSRITWPELPAD